MVKLFRNGRNQAVRVPRAFELPGEVAIMRTRNRRGGRRHIALALDRTLVRHDGAFARVPALKREDWVAA